VKDADNSKAFVIYEYITQTHIIQNT